MQARGGEYGRKSGTMWPSAITGVSDGLGRQSSRRTRAKIPQAPVRVPA
jgi:hypothetical protein